MKVRELISKCHLYTGQHTTSHDRGETKKKYVSANRYAFELGSDITEYLLGLKVNSFECNESGLTINAE